MSEALRMWVEIVFNILYLIVVWALVALMIAKRNQVAPGVWPVARLLIAAFALLALGDTGHVGFRVWAYALGGLEAQIGGIGLVGIGALSTAYTVTLFYVLVLMAWRQRFGKPYGVVGWILFGAAAARLLVMLLPQNDWNSVVPPQPWSLVRNFPLIVQGLGVAYLILRDARAAHDPVFRAIGVWILVSYAFYTPVILFVQTTPIVGMLMIPKTLAYVAIAWLAYRSFFPNPEPASLASGTALGQ